MFTLIEKKWFGWIMFPGYTDVPYASPIYIYKVEPLKTGRGTLRLDFFNAAYAVGVQRFDKELRVLHRAPTFLYARIVDQEDRGAIIGHLGIPWLQKLCPPALEGWDGSASDESLDAFLTRRWLGGWE